jgi:glycerol-3-phosphate dehydrogenase
LPGCDVIVIGAGIVGTMIARELSKLKGRFALIEKEPFLCFGVSKAGLSQIHLPDFCPPGSLKGKLCADANRSRRLKFLKLSAGGRTLLTGSSTSPAQEWDAARARSAASASSIIWPSSLGLARPR